jgi:hypothetical protein
MKDTLTHLGIDAWLQDPAEARLALSPPVVNGNQITAIIEVENQKVSITGAQKAAPHVGSELLPQLVQESGRSTPQRMV